MDVLGSIAKAYTNFRLKELFLKGNINGLFLAKNFKTKLKTQNKKMCLCVP